MQKRPAVGDRAADAARRTASIAHTGHSPRSHIMRTSNARKEASTSAEQPAGSGQSRRTSPAFGRPCGSTPCWYLPRTESRTGDTPTAAHGVQLSAGRREWASDEARKQWWQAAHAKKLSIAAELR